MPSIDIEDVWKRYGSIVALRGINLHVDDGEYLCLLGPTGAGKTTLLKIIAGLVLQDKGRILIDGIDMSNIPPEFRNTSYMPQGYALFPNMNVWENVAYGAWVRERDLKDAEHALKIMGLWNRRFSYPHELSGGQQQRIALARALASGSKILLLDEPLSALDALLNLQLRFELKKLAKNLGLTVIHVTHNPEVALSIADKIAILRKGVILQIDEPNVIYNRPNNLFTANFLSRLNIFTGRVLGCRGRECLFKIEGLGEIYAYCNYDIDLDAVIGYRPEDVKIMTHGYEGLNIFTGYVKEISNLGFFTRVIVNVNEYEVISYIWSGDYVPSVNDPVSVVFPSDKALVFPYPEEGLEEALSVE